ncbi:MAG: ATP-binding cassette domain-containing protein [Candidatus Limnocylindrales bacterium]
MDEPTASLSAHEVRRLFRIIAALRREGVAILFISHRMEEVFEIADRVTVLRDGRWISTRPVSDVTPDLAIRDMVGRVLEDLFRRTPTEPGEVVLDVRDLGRDGAFSGVSFTVRAGEVLGFAGLVGARRTDVGLALFGIAPADTGEVRLDGQSITVTSPQQALERGIAYTTEDRRELGLIFPLSIAANISLPTLRRYLSRAGLIRRGAEDASAGAFKDRLKIRAATVKAPVATLSGGNQQKVVLSKWLNTRPRVLILDEPTRGIDVRSKAEVHQIIDELAHEGMAIILISSDLPEVLATSDRILVMREGRQMAILDRTEATQERGARGCHGSRPTHRGGCARMRRLMRYVRPEQLRELTLVFIIIAVLAFFATQIPDYLSGRTFTRISTSVAVIAVVAVGQTLVVLTRNIDLSVGSIVGVVAYVTGTLLTNDPNLSPAIAIAVAIGLGGVLGALNGLLVAYGRVPAIVTTLGTLALYRVALVELSGAKTVTTDALPSWLLDLPATSLVSLGALDIRPLVVLALLIVVDLPARCCGISRTAGACSRSARTRTRAQVAGFRVQRDVFAAFLLSGALSGLAGFMFLARFGNITVVAGQGLELQAVAAVVVGGVNIFGGIGSVVGALLGATPDRPAPAEPDPLARGERVPARCDPGPADPARRRLGQGHPGSLANASGFVSAGSVIDRLRPAAEATHRCA